MFNSIFNNIFKNRFTKYKNIIIIIFLREPFCCICSSGIYVISHFFKLTFCTTDILPKNIEGKRPPCRHIIRNFCTCTKQKTYFHNCPPLYKKS